MGLSKMRAPHVNHILLLIDQSGSDFLKFGALVEELFKNDFVIVDKVPLSQKLNDRQKQREDKAKLKLKEVHRNHDAVNDLQQRLSNEAQKRGQTEILESSCQEDLEALFFIEQELTKTINKKRARLNTAFMEMDQEGKGHITKTDFGKGLMRFGVQITRRQLDLAFPIFDVDGGGTVEFKEFSRILKAASVQRHKRITKRSEIEDKPNQHPVEEEKINGDNRIGEKTNATNLLVEEKNSPASQTTKNSKHVETKPVCVHCKGGSLRKSPPTVPQPSVSLLLPHVSNDNERFLTVLVSDREFKLEKQWIKVHSDCIFSQIPESSKVKVFVDMDPNLFEIVLSKLHGLNSSPKHSKYTPSALVYACRVLGFECKEFEDLGKESDVPLIEPPATKHYEIKFTNEITSIGTFIHVREHEKLIVDSVSGSGHLVVDIFAADRQIFPEPRAEDISVFDSRAYFQTSNSTIQVGDIQLPGNAQYFFKTHAVENVIPSKVKLIVQFRIVTGIPIAT